VKLEGGQSVVSERWRKRFRIGGRGLLYVLVVCYLLLILADLSSLRTNISAMAGEISSLQSDVNSIQSDVSSIQDTVNSIEQDLQDLTTDDQPEAGRSVAKRQGNRAYMPRFAAWHPHRIRRFSRKLSSHSSRDSQTAHFRNFVKRN
jgi:chromosome segregation ATPase